MPPIPRRIAAAFAVLCGRYGDVTRMAQDRDRSRQSLYREAEKVVLAVDGTGAQARVEGSRRRLADQQAENRSLRERLERAVEITRETHDEFASVAQAEGVSLGAARRPLQVVAGSKPVPGVATLRRATLEAGRHAGGRLEVLDQAARPRVEQAAADEIFGPSPALTVVEPEGLCWITGRMAGTRDGATGAQEFARLPAPRAVAPDDGSGLGKGISLDNRRRRDAGLPEFGQTLEVFHTLRQGGVPFGRPGAWPLGHRGGPRWPRRPSAGGADRGDHARAVARA